VARLAGAQQATDADLAVATSGGRAHPVIALWPIALAEPLRQALARGESRVGAVVAGFRPTFVDWPIEPVDPFLNVNAEADLAAAEAALRRGA
jgi:molybdopterin-guanine dinucleotide biosynthesis protein A